MFKGKAIIGCNSRKLNSCGKSAADAPPIHPFVHKGQVRSQAEQVQPLLKFLSRDLQDVATDVRPQLRIHLQLKFWFPASFGLLGHPSGRGCCCFSSSSIHHKVSNISRTQSIENHEKNDIFNLYHYLHKSGYQGSVPANNDYISNQAIWVNPEEEEVNCSKAGEQSSWQINIIREASYITLHWTENRGKPDLQPKKRIVAWCKSSSTALWTTSYHCLLYKVHK